VTGELVLLGVDGGNTKTIAVAAASDGTILGSGRVLRRSDIHAVPVDQALAVYREAAGLALAAIRRDPPPRFVAAFSLAGADWPEDVDLLRGRLASSWPDVTVVNDAIGALRAAIPAGPGVVIVCGTGTATGARGPDGQTWHSGFWQEAQGAHELGVRTLQAIYRSELGIDGPTELTDRVLAATRERDVEALLHHATGREVVDRRDSAVLAPILLQAADDGDGAAVEIVDRQGKALAWMALAAARRVGIPLGDDLTVALTGGVLRGSRGRLRDAIASALAEGWPQVRIVEPALEPVAGALLLAFDAAGIPADDRHMRRIEDGLRSADLFDTRSDRTPPERG
jgi:N-acetylglucosamine kinase-like BadF-type ATPase